MSESITITVTHNGDDFYVSVSGSSFDTWGQSGYGDFTIREIYEMCAIEEPPSHPIDEDTGRK